MNALKFILILLQFLIVSKAKAAPAVSSPVCVIKGLIKKIEKREVDYKPESWRKSWNLPKSREYVDVTIAVSTAKGLEGKAPQCDSLVGLKKFQLRDTTVKISTSQCIVSQTQFSGDEFALGQWIFKIKELKKESCR